MSQIICKNLSLGYENKIIVKNLNFSVNKGDYLCIVGENGSGKSTLMKTLLSLQKPIFGTLEYADGLKHDELGYLPQQTSVQKDFPASVFEVVISGCQGRMGLRPFYTKKEKATALENMEKMNISDIKNRCYRELSGGQQQRVLLARALCAAKKVLLLDEPVSGLDPQVTSQMYSLIAELNKKYGLTVIMISHDISAAVNYGSHILHIGHSVFFGKTEDYINSDLGKAFLSAQNGGKV